MANFNVDPMHSEVHFSVKSLMISTVSGTFSKFHASVKSDKPDFSDAQVDFEINADSLSTNNPQRDEHLRGTTFFDVAKFPTISFHSTNVRKYSDKSLLLTGTLSMHGESHDVSFIVDYHGTAKDSFGNLKSGFDAEAKINRSAFGLVWNAALEAGGVVVSDEVKIRLHIQLMKVA